MKYKPLIFGGTPEPVKEPLPKPASEVPLPHHTQEENKLREILEAEITGTTWEVICVVSRHKGDDEKKARAAFTTYVEKSDLGYGRVGHEPVILMHDGKVVQEHKWAGPKGSVR